MNAAYAKHIANVDKHRDLILEAERHIWKNPETGFREWKTSAYLAEQFEALGYELTRAGDIPGFYTDLDTGRPGPTALVMGELDALFCNTHPEADPETNAVHVCGHNAQCAALLGVAAALKEPGALDGMCGKIRLMAVPAEELVEFEFREELRQKGVIRYLGGKPEFIARGYMDDVDVAFMIHTSSNVRNAGARVINGHNGFINKHMVFQGKARHASAPYSAINALYAATQAINALNALRETFRERDTVRLHPIISHGGDAVNTIPDVIKVECQIRGSNPDAIREINSRANRAAAGAALSMGANVVYCDRPGYMPNIHDKTMIDAFLTAGGEVLGQENVYYQDVWEMSCTDMGDVSSLEPSIHPHIGGSIGNAHGNNWYIADPERACVDSAKVQAVLLQVLLENDAALAKQAKETFRPRFANKEEYMAFMDTMMVDGEAITYHEDGTATVRYE